MHSFWGAKKFKQKGGWGFGDPADYSDPEDDDEEEEEEEEEEYSYSYTEEEEEEEEQEEERKVIAIADLAVGEAVVRAVGIVVAEGIGEEASGEIVNRLLANIHCFDFFNL